MLKDDPKFNIKKANQAIFDSLKSYFNNKGLWTVGVSDTTYKDQLLFSNILLNSQYIKGFGKTKPGFNFELSVDAGVNFLDDTLSKGMNLKRIVLNLEPGLNWIIRAKNNKQSFFEFKLSGSYINNFGTRYINEKKDSLFLNGTLRVRIIDDVWIPLEIKYYPRSGNIFGFINVRANFTGLGNLLKPKSKS